MEQTKIDHLAPMKLATIVALRGQSSPRKSKFARQLAGFLNYPLLDEEDILKVSSAAGKIESVPHETCLEIIFHTASLHLVHSRIGLVISSSAFSSPQALQRFHDMKISTGAHMIVIMYENKVVGSDLTDFPAVWIAPAKSVVLQGRLGREILGFFTVTRETETKNLHFHYLIPVPNIGKREEKSSCRKCFKTISSQRLYRCKGCGDCAFHIDCAETPRFNREKDTARQFPPCFSGIPLPADQFPTGNPCSSCSDKAFSEECWECLYEAFIRLGSYPAIVAVTGHHPHALRYVIVPRSYGYKYQCPICEADGEIAGYKCTECCFDFHPICVMNCISRKLKIVGV